MIFLLITNLSLMIDQSPLSLCFIVSRPAFFLFIN